MQPRNRHTKNKQVGKQLTKITAKKGQITLSNTEEFPVLIKMAYSQYSKTNLPEEDETRSQGSSSFSSWQHLLASNTRKRALGRVKTTAVRILKASFSYLTFFLDF